MLDATNAYAYFVQDEAGLAGLPGDAIEAAREAAQKDAKEGWKFTLHFPSYFPVLQYADNRTARGALPRLCDARVGTRPQYGDGKAEWDNTAIVADALKLRREER